MVVPAPIGNGGLFLAIAAFVSIVGLVTKRLREVHEAEGADDRRFREVMDRTEAADAVLDRYQADWDARGATGEAFYEWLISKDWEAVTLARLLGCEPTEAEALLSGFGFGVDRGAWRHRPDAQGRLLDGNMKILLFGYGESSGVPEAEIIEARTRTFAQSGEAPPDMGEIGWNPDSGYADELASWGLGETALEAARERHRQWRAE
jgi:hypothetical protein